MADRRRLSGALGAALLVLPAASAFGTYRRLDAWHTVATATVRLNPKIYHTFDNVAGWVAMLGLEPGYYVSFEDPQGKVHQVPLANLLGSRKVKDGLPVVDPRRDQARYVLVMKDGTQVVMDDQKTPTVLGSGGLTGGPFKGLAVPRNTSSRTRSAWPVPHFLAENVREIRLQTKSLKSH